MMQTRFGAINLSQVQPDAVIRYSDAMNPYLGEPADTRFFVVKEVNPKKRKEVTETREVAGAIGKKRGKEATFIQQVVRVFPFRWDPKTGLAIKAGPSEERMLYFSKKGEQHPAFDVVENATVAYSEGEEIFALHVPAPKATPRLLTARA